MECSSEVKNNFEGWLTQSAVFLKGGCKKKRKDSYHFMLLSSFIASRHSWCKNRFFRMNKKAPFWKKSSLLQKQWQKMKPSQRKKRPGRGWTGVHSEWSSIQFNWTELGLQEGFKPAPGKREPGLSRADRLVGLEHAFKKNELAIKKKPGSIEL